MNICIPTKTDEGINSSVSEHFGSAPYFLIFNDQDSTCKSIGNSIGKHEHGKCMPVKELSKLSVDAVICNGMGMRALQNLNTMGIKAYRAENELPTVKDVVQAFKLNEMQELTAENSCPHHNSGQNCHK